eukprot:TRINITY_DN46893_c0_g1_i1.p2 TRINITY_DN46893_c0_g1~~TRINITY_DN46893_c0_g1_i1.p2  ORF type:complete len:124 (+),score=17.27 TRINITY_DN46893_c0_g1_i1:478-849(+)
MGEHLEMPILFCARPPDVRNKILHLILRGRRPELGFGYNSLACSEDLPEHRCSWIAFVFDSARVRRILVNGRIVSQDSSLDAFLGAGNIEVGQWEIGSKKKGGFEGSIADLQCVKKAMTNREI